MSRPRSFTEFLDWLLRERGYARRGRADWYRFIGQAVVVVNLQKSAFGAGLYLNFGLSFLTGSRRFYPKHYDCLIFGRNPASLPLRPEVRFQSLLDRTPEVLRNRRLLVALGTFLWLQLEAIESWAEVAKLRRRIESDEPLDMLVYQARWRRVKRRLVGGPKRP